MVTTPNLAITHIEVSQQNKKASANAAFDALDEATQDTIDIDCSAGGTVTVPVASQLANKLLRLTGSPAGAFTLDLQPTKRNLAIQNVSGQTATIDTTSGSTPTTDLATGQTLSLIIRGADITFIGTKGDGSGGAAGSFGRKSEYIPAAAMQPSVTKPCSGLQIVEGTAGQPNIHVRDFDDGVTVTLEEAQFQAPFPNRWNKSTITFEVFDTHAGGQTATQDGRVWGLSAVAISSDEAWDTAFGTEVLVTIDQANANRVHKSSESAAVTVAGTPADDDFIFFRIRRKTDDAADDMDQDARLLGVRIYWTEDAAVDD